MGNTLLTYLLQNSFFRSNRVLTVIRAHEVILNSVLMWSSFSCTGQVKDGSLTKTQGSGILLKQYLWAKKLVFNKVPLQIAVAFSLIIRELTVPSPAQTDKHSQNKSCAYTNTQINYTSEEVLFLLKKTSEKHSSTSKLHRSPNA